MHMYLGIGGSAVLVKISNYKICYFLQKRYYDKNPFTIEQSEYLLPEERSTTSLL